MNYKQAEQRLKELLSTGFMVETGGDTDISREVDELIFKLHKWDRNLFEVCEAFHGGTFDSHFSYCCLYTVECWKFFGVSSCGETEVSDEPVNEVIITKEELNEIVEAIFSKDEIKYQSKVTGTIYTFVDERTPHYKSSPDVLLKVGNDIVHCPKQNLYKCFDLVVNSKPEPEYVPIKVNVVEDKFEAVSGDQSLFDLVGASDTDLYVVRNSQLNGIYATDFKVAKERILAERKLKKPEHISYHTEHYPHEDYEGKVYAFRARNGQTAINFIDGDYSGEVVLTPENTIKFANELITIANGVERKDYK